MLKECLVNGEIWLTADLHQAASYAFVRFTVFGYAVVHARRTLPPCGVAGFDGPRQLGLIEIGTPSQALM